MTKSRRAICKDCNRDSLIWNSDTKKFRKCNRTTCKGNAFCWQHDDKRMDATKEKRKLIKKRATRNKRSDAELKTMAAKFLKDMQNEKKKAVASAVDDYDPDYEPNNEPIEPIFAPSKASKATKKAKKTAKKAKKSDYPWDTDPKDDIFPPSLDAKHSEGILWKPPQSKKLASSKASKASKASEALKIVKLSNAGKKKFLKNSLHSVYDKMPDERKNELLHTVTLLKIRDAGNLLTKSEVKKATKKANRTLKHNKDTAMRKAKKAKKAKKRKKQVNSKKSKKQKTSSQANLLRMLADDQRMINR